MWTIVLLVLSNIFMTFAWYGHLRFFPGHSQPLWLIVLFSWSIALPEYALAVPANRIGIGRYHFEPAQLKTIQEIVTLIVFGIFSMTVLKQKLAWNHIAGFACIVAAGLFIFNPFTRASPVAADAMPAAATTAPNESTTP